MNLLSNFKGTINVLSNMKTLSKKYPFMTFENGVWSGPKAVYPDDDAQVGKKLLEVLRQSPDFIGQIDSATGEIDTYGDMAERSVRCALWLKKQGIGPGDVVSVSTHNHINTMIPILASLYVGCTLNTFLMNSLDEDITAYFIDTVDSKIVFANEEAARLVTKYNEVNGKNVKIVTFEDLPGFTNFYEILKESSADDVRNFECYEIPSLADCSMIVFSSGSTGVPKAFYVPYRRFAYLTVRQSHEINDNCIITWRSKVCWLFTIRLALSVIRHKFTYVIVSDDLEIAEFCRIIEKYKVNRIEFDVNDVNAICELDNIEDYDFKLVKLVGWVGGRTRAKTQERLAQIFSNAWLSQTYGITEFGTVTYAMKDFKIGSCGIPAPNVQIKIKNCSGETITEPNQVGEFHVNCPHLSVVYFNNPVETEKATDSDGWYITGDLGYYDEDGEFFIVDRIKEMIRFRTDDVPPSVIENLISKHPAVANVAVVAKLDDADIEQPAAFIVKKTDAKVTEKEIIDSVEKNLPDRMRLRGGVQFLDKMPCNTSGKVDKKKLRQLINNC